MLIKKITITKKIIKKLKCIDFFSLVVFIFILNFYINCLFIFSTSAVNIWFILNHPLYFASIFFIIIMILNKHLNIWLIFNFFFLFLYYENIIIQFYYIFQIIFWFTFFGDFSFFSSWLIFCFGKLYVDLCLFYYFFNFKSSVIPNSYLGSCFNFLFLRFFLRVFEIIMLPYKFLIKKSF